MIPIQSFLKFRKGKLTGAETKKLRSIVRRRSHVEGRWERKLLHSSRTGIIQRFFYSKPINRDLYGRVIIETASGKQIAEVSFEESGPNKNRFLFIQALTVHGNNSKEGFATQMLSEIIAFAEKRRRIKSLLINVEKENHSAIRVYKKLGFVEGKTFFDTLEGKRAECMPMRLKLDK
jgi:ribosomal protein S18 acetylase RimI-like enzyme